VNFFNPAEVLSNFPAPKTPKFKPQIQKPLPSPYLSSSPLQSPLSVFFRDSKKIPQKKKNLNISDPKKKCPTSPNLPKKNSLGGIFLPKDFLVQSFWFVKSL
jgi:hypothetical protein